MAIIGNQILSTNYLSDQFSGDGSTVAFTLSLAPASAASISVYVSGLYQIPGSAYTVSGSTLTFTGAPPTGTNNIYVLYLGVKNQNLVPVNGSITPQMLNNANVVYWGTGNNNVGIGTTTPSSPLEVNGAFKTTSLSVNNVAGGNPDSIFVVQRPDSNTVQLYAYRNTANVGYQGLDFKCQTQFTWGMGSEQMRLDGYGRLLIGRSTPYSAEQLGVSTSNTEMACFNSTATTGGFLRFNKTDSVYGYVGCGAALSSGSNTDFTVRSDAALALASGGGYERMRVDANGNTGFGTYANTVSSKVEVVGRIESRGLATDPNYAIYMQGLYDSSHAANVAVAINSSPTEIIGVYAEGGGASPRLVLNPNNGWKVGINTTSPQAKLDVGGAPNSTIGTQAGFFSGAKTNYAGYAGLPQNQLFVYDNTSGYGAGTGGAISFGGNAGSGQETWYASICAEKLNGTANDYGGNLTFYTRPQNTVPAISMKLKYDSKVEIGPMDAASPDGRLSIRDYGGNIASFYYGATKVGSITTGGSTTAFNTSSDYRLKNNIQPLIGSGAFIDALLPKSWIWATSGAQGAGFVAHEAQQVTPSSVTGNKDAVDEDGNPVYQMMDNSSPEIMANIVAELQSLRARVAELENK